MITEQEIQDYLNTHDKGVLSHGGHNSGDGAYCALECITQLRQGPDGGPRWSDSPKVAAMPDVRPINDAPWSSDAARTKAMLPMLTALSTWPDWSTRQKQQWGNAVCTATVQQVISQLPHISQKVRNMCQNVTNLKDAESAAYAAKSAARSAAKSAESAAESAASAAWSAAKSAEYAAWSAARSAKYAAKYAAKSAAYAAKSAEYAAWSAARSAKYAAKSAEYAAWSAARSAAYAAKSAEYAAWSASWSAAYAVDNVLITVCQIWQTTAENIK